MILASSLAVPERQTFEKSCSAQLLREPSRSFASTIPASDYSPVIRIPSQRSLHAVTWCYLSRHRTGLKFSCLTARPTLESPLPSSSSWQKLPFACCALPLGWSLDGGHLNKFHPRLGSFSISFIYKVAHNSQPAKKGYKPRILPTSLLSSATSGPQSKHSHTLYLACAALRTRSPSSSDHHKDHLHRRSLNRRSVYHQHPQHIHINHRHNDTPIQRLHVEHRRSESLPQPSTRQPCQREHSHVDTTHCRCPQLWTCCQRRATPLA